MKVLFIAPQIMGTRNPLRKLATFHEADVHLLWSLGYEVDILPWYGRPWSSLLRRMRRCDAVFCWTVGDHTVLSIMAGKFLHKPVAVVIGGYEFANLPQVSYGNLATSRGQILSKIAWRHADALLFVDPSLEQEGERAFGPRDGINAIIPTGYDPSYWSENGTKEDIALTVAHAPSLGRFRLKGVDRFLALALRFPQIKFHVIGQMPENLWMYPGALCENTVFHGWMERDAIRKLYGRARVYLQLSQHEGLPNGLCEAMLSGCIPIGTPVNGIPRAIGNRGLLVQEGEEDEAFRFAMDLSDYGGMRARARARIRNLFPLERRRQGLRRVLETII